MSCGICSSLCCFHGNSPGKKNQKGTGKKICSKRSGLLSLLSYGQCNCYLGYESGVKPDSENAGFVKGVF